MFKIQDNQSQIFHYNGSSITFRNGDRLMVNATEMAKPFGKNAGHWMRNQSTKDFIKELGALRNCKGSDLVIIENGIGTWMHEDVAIEFARWLSPSFAIWCNDRIKELMQTGVTTTQNDDEAILHAIVVLQKRVEESKQRLQIAESTITEQQKQISELAPKADYTDKVLQSRQTYTFTQVAKELDMTSATSLIRKLKEMNVIFSQSGQWQLRAKYCGNGYTNTRTSTFTHKDGTIGTSSSTVWTEKGRVFIHSLFNDKK